MKPQFQIGDIVKVNGAFSANLFANVLGVIYNNKRESHMNNYILYDVLFITPEKKGIKAYSFYDDEIIKL